MYNYINAKYITHCGYSIENNIASDIRLSRNVVNKESKSSRRFVRNCNTSSAVAHETSWTFRFLIDHIARQTNITSDIIFDITTLLIIKVE